jgi:hypothetical protein
MGETYLVTLNGATNGYYTLSSLEKHLNEQ